MSSNESIKTELELEEYDAYMKKIHNESEQKCFPLLRNIYGQHLTIDQKENYLKRLDKLNKTLNGVQKHVLEANKAVLQAYKDLQVEKISDTVDLRIGTEVGRKGTRDNKDSGVISDYDSHLLDQIDYEENEPDTTITRFVTQPCDDELKKQPSTTEKDDNSGRDRRTDSH